MKTMSIAARLALAQVLAILVLCAFAAWLTYSQTRETVYRLQTDHVLATTHVAAESESVQQAFLEKHPEESLQPLALAMMDQAEVSWITFMDLDGTRLSHWQPNWVGSKYSGEIHPAVEGRDHIETSVTGDAGPSVRAISPVWVDGEVVGVVAAGQTVSELDVIVDARIPRLLIMTGFMVAIGLGVSWFLHRYLTRVTYGLGPEQLAEQFRFADTSLHHASEGIMLLSPDHRVRTYNDRAAELLNLPPHDTADPHFRTIAELGLPEALQALFESARETSDELYSCAGRILVVNQHGTTTGRGGRVVTLFDHTDVQQMNHELEATRSLSSALRAQTHEHANQLHTVLSLLELNEVDRAKQLLGQTSSHLADQEIFNQAGAQEPDIQALLIAKSAQAGERGITFTVRLRAEGPSGISATDLITVAGNLIDNAIDAVDDLADPEHRWIDVEVLSENGWLSLQVADGGEGPDAEHEDQIFELGWSSKPSDQLGRGLGLALVQQTVHRLGGSVELVRDSGTVFTVELPWRADRTGQNHASEPHD
ncbi:MAG: ATP-binding protein [Micrococcaceae bacterium]